MDLQATLLFATSLIAIVNPLSSSVLFVTSASKFAQAVQSKMADQSALAIAVVLLVCAWAGRYLLLVLGINILVTATAFGLLARGIGGLLPGLAK